MVGEFKKYISENNLIGSKERILLGVSGGIDSMVMAHLFLTAGYNTGIAHCNFSLRNEESDQDEDLVRQFAVENKLPFYTVKFDTPLHAGSSGISIQMAARELRYNWFEKVMNENGFGLLAVAHNLNDNIETLIINLTRGTGIAGLSGIKPLNNRIIRPLLFATRTDIENYCRQTGITYREDSSNKDTKYTRNKIRHKIIPVLKQINPSIETTLNETAERFAGINEIVNEYISNLRHRISHDNGSLISYNIELLNPYLHNKTILFELFKPFGIGSVMLNELIRLIEGKTGGQVFTGSHRIVKNRNEIIISSDEYMADISHTVENILDFFNIPQIESAYYTDVTSSFEISSDPSVAYVDSDKLKFPLTLRKWKSGDRFHPLGMRQQKKLSDYFIDSKFSLFEKENKFVMESEGQIFWIIGDRIDDRFKISSFTKRALIITAAKKAMKIIPLK